jgi:hypothetical protein
MLAEGAWEVARRQGAMVRPQLRVRRRKVAGGARWQVRGRGRARQRWRDELVGASWQSRAGRGEPAGGCGAAGAMPRARAVWREEAGLRVSGREEAGLRVSGRELGAALGREQGVLGRELTGMGSRPSGLELGPPRARGGRLGGGETEGAGWRSFGGRGSRREPGGRGEVAVAGAQLRGRGGAGPRSRGRGLGAAGSMLSAQGSSGRVTSARRQVDVIDFIKEALRAQILLCDGPNCIPPLRGGRDGWNTITNLRLAHKRCNLLPWHPYSFTRTHTNCP